MRQLVVALALSLIMIGLVLYFVIGTGPQESTNTTGQAALDTGTAAGKAAQSSTTPKTEVKPLPKRVRRKLKVEVHVVDEQGKPVPRAQVQIDKVRDGEERTGARIVVAKLVTDRNGLAVTPDWIEEGYYRFSAVAVGYAPTTDSRVVAATGDKKIVRVKLVLYSGDTISGRIMNENSVPIEGARVLAYEALGREGASEFEWIIKLLDKERLERPLSEARSDKNGHYVLRGLKKGLVCAVRVTADGYTPAERGGIKAGSRNVDFRLSPGSILGGRVVTADGTPIGGATVEAYRDLGKPSDLRAAIANALRGALDSVTTAADGTFEFRTLGEGRFILYASAPGFQESHVSVSVYRGRAEPAVIELNPGLLLAGRVVDPEGKPIQGAVIRARSRATARRVTVAVNREKEPEVESDANGQFRFDTLSPGSYTLIVSHDDYASVQLKNVEVPQENLTVTMEYGGGIAGFVRDRDGNPIPGARVWCHDLAGVRKESITDENGHYQLVVSVKPLRKKHLNVQATGYARPESTAVVVEEGKVVNKDFELDRASGITGLVKDTQGRPIANVNVMVQLLPDEETPVQRYLGYCTTGEDGRFQIDNISPRGRVKLIAEHRFFLKWESEPFQIMPGEILEAEIQMQSGGSLSGIVVDDNGNPVKGARVKAVAPGASEREAAFGGGFGTTDEQGRFVLRGLGAGTYEVLASASGYLEGRSEAVTLAEGAGVSGITVTLPKAHRLAGVVRTTDGRPVPGARITVVDTSVDGVRKLGAASKEDGSWEVEGLGSQPVEVSAEADGYGRVTLKEVKPDTQDVLLELPPLGGVSGIVVNQDGKPVRAFSVKPIPVEIDQGYSRPRNTRFKTFGNVDGSFKFEDLPPGTYTLNVQSPGYRGTTLENVRVDAGQITDVGTLTLLPGGVLVGRVLDATGAPVAGAKVSVVGGVSKFSMAPGRTPRATVTTGPDGTFKFEGLRSGRVKVRVSAEGFVPTVSEEVDPNLQKEELVVTLQPSSGIQGVVIGPDRNPLSGIQVFLKGVGVNVTRGTRTDAQGRFVFSDIPPGTYRVRTFKFRKPNEKEVREAIEELRVGPGEQVEVVLQRG